ncbi:MAG TPA: FAD/NAD(P)-binding protein, partial [Acidimicrobiales bacterium]|nr:FAD/NAD(P)-binding protein [Acidimicrobiales bacterium]
MTEAGPLSCDYLVVGAGAVGMAFVDSLIEDPGVEVVMVDRRPGPGGHWLDAYPFVRLHQPSANYGVSSTPLGLDRIDQDGHNQGFYELAGSAEICGYFDGVMRHRFLPSGRVRFLPMTDHLGDGRIRSLLTGEETQVTVRRRLVDATFLSSRIPATEPPPFEVADGVRCVPVGDLTAVVEPPEGFVIVGGGKTSADACTWLLEQGTPPDAITWIRPRDAWWLNRVHFQPHAAAIGTFEGVVLELEAVAAATSVEDAYDRLEASRTMLRIDPDVRPTMVKGATISEAEVEGLRRIEDVVRLGHVRRIELDRIVLDDGSVPTSPDRLHVHCAAPGLPLNPPRPIFAEDRITLQSSIRMHPTLSAALAGYVETTDRSIEEKNRLV